MLTIVQDSTFTTMSFDDWEQSVRPKVQGSWNLHAVLPKKMDFFVFLSSVCGIFGNGGQSNYAAGNTYEDALARYRVSQGEKATALDLGILLSEGFVAEHGHVMEWLLRLRDMLPIAQDELFALFDYYCDPQLPVPTPFSSQVITGLETPANMREQGRDISYAMQAPLFRHMHQIDGSCQASARPTESVLDFKALFEAAASLTEAGDIVSEALKTKLSKVMGIPEDNIELHHRVESYGVDSLVAVELRNWLAKEMSADIAVFEILGGATVKGVGLTVAAKSSFRQTSWTQ